MVGGIFISVVFLTYLVLGVGVYLGLEQLTGLKQWISPLIYGLAFLLLLILAGYNLYDAAVVWATGRTRQMKLQLPDSIKRKIHEIIRTRLTLSGLLTGVAVTGFLVTLLESVCTGQVYVPTIVFVLQQHPEERIKALLYLLLYNVMFIVPLGAVFALAYLGVSSQRLAAWGQRNVIPVKIGLALIFLVMAFVLGWSLFLK